MTGDNLRDARQTLGLSLTEMAERLRLALPNGRTMLREMESGKRDVSGPISVAVEMMLREERNG
jgi:cytoskeletal protein RodZ